MGKQKAFQAFLLTILLPILTIAATFPVSLNVNGTVKLSGSGGDKTVELTAGEPQEVTLSWLTQTEDITVEATSKNPRYFDSTFTTEVPVKQFNYPAWDKSKTYETANDTVTHKGKLWYNQWWANPGMEPSVQEVWAEVVDDEEPYSLKIVLEAKPLPTDTAFVPVMVNVEAKITCTPLEMIKGNVPNKDFVFNLEPKKRDTLILPVNTEGISVINSSSISNKPVGFYSVKGKHFISLQESMKNVSLHLIALNGREISQFKVTNEAQHDFSIWNLATGMYILRVQSASGKNFHHKIVHHGGDFKAAINSGKSFTVGGILNSRTVRVGDNSRAEKAKYRITVDAVDAKYKDTTFEISLSGQMNDFRNIYLVDPNGNNFDQLVDEDAWEELFPNRYGFGKGHYIVDPLPDNPDDIIPHPADGDYDFYTYASLSKAIDSMSLIEVDLYQLEGHNYMHRIVWRNKKTGQSRTMVNNIEYENYKKTSEEKLIQTIDYGNFCSEGDVETRKQELAAFLGNISHETTGAGTEEKSKTWGLYWREEAAWQKGSTALGYVDQFPNELYKPSANQSYHGRGPIQITHNVNYGQLSEFFYGDKQILLDDPGMLVPDKPEDATVAFMSAIWFWMTPQAPKPSCHDVMVENWTANSEEAAKNWNRSKFGMTIFIINGGLECNKGDGTSSPLDRIEFYKRYCQVLGITPEGYCDCGDMKP